MDFFQKYAWRVVLVVFAFTFANEFIFYHFICPERKRTYDTARKNRRIFSPASYNSYTKTNTKLSKDNVTPDPAGNE
jgi:hypothetical protein